MTLRSALYIILWPFLLAATLMYAFGWLLTCGAIDEDDARDAGVETDHIDIEV